MSEQTNGDAAIPADADDAAPDLAEITEPVVEATEPVVEAVAEETAPAAVEAIAEVAQPVTDVAGATAAVVEPVTEIAKPVLRVAEPVLESTAPVIETVEMVAARVPDYVASTAAIAPLAVTEEKGTPLRDPSRWIMRSNDVGSAAGPTEAERFTVRVDALPMPATSLFQPGSSDSQRAASGAAARLQPVLEVSITSDALIHSTGTALAGLAVLLVFALAHPAHGDGRLLSASVIWRPTRSVRPPTPHG